MYVGLDLSLRETGIGFLGDEINAFVIKGPKNRNGVYRLDYLERRIFRSIDRVADQITGLAIEGYSMGSKGRVFDIGELGGIIKLGLRRRSIPSVIVPPTVLKQFVTGKGNADKKKMIAHVSDNWYETRNDNEADAVGLSVFANAYFGGDHGDSKYTFAELQKKCILIPCG